MNLKRQSIFYKPNSKTLTLFVTAGFPSTETTVPLVLALADAGADVIELGIPFSDPSADGPVIQSSSKVALQNGVTLSSTLAMAQQIRERTSIPLVLMGYANPIFSYGLTAFFSHCQSIGINGVIIPDLPLEESEEYCKQAKKYSIATIFLAAPTTPDERLVQLDQLSEGFLYCVSVTGVTGERREISEPAIEFLSRARALVVKNPLFAGFGISSPESARQVSEYTDGVIVGSGLIKILQESAPDERIPKAVAFVQSLRNALTP